MITIPVPVPGNSYQVHVGRFAGPAAVADAVTSGLGKVSGVAVLVDQTVGQRSPRVEPLVAALGEPVAFHDGQLSKVTHCPTHVIANSGTGAAVRRRVNVCSLWATPDSDRLQTR